MKRQVLDLANSLLIVMMVMGTTILAQTEEKPVRATIKPEKTLNQIDRRVYGQFLEHLYNAVNNGLWGDLVYNRSLEMPKSIVQNKRWANRKQYELQDEVKKTGNVRYWDIDPAKTEWRTGDARNSSKYVRFLASGSMTQNNFRFVQGEIYDWSCWVRGEGQFTMIPGSVPNNIVFKGKFDSPMIHSDQWVKFSGQFTVGETTDSGQLVLKFEPVKAKSLDIDQISIMPRSWKKDHDGMRPDLIEAIRAIHPPTIRWPGGCYASAYRWKSGIGSQDDRVSHPMEYRNDIDVNSFGTDEFITLCRKVNADPIFVVNLGTKEWLKHAGCEHETIDWQQDICDWVEYCNGPVTSKWGAKRAANGHPEPFHVKYWEIDNEVNPGTTSVEEYIKIIRKLVPRMKAVSPDIKIIVCGSWIQYNDEWDKVLIHEVGSLFDFLSTHRYDDPKDFANAPWEIQKFFNSRRELILKSDHPNIRVYHSEWNAQSIDWRNGLYAGGFLNVAERSSDIISICSPCLFLRGIDGVDWNNSLINLDNKTWFPAPNYVVMKLWYDHFAPNRVELVSNAPELNGDTPVLNAVATKTNDDKTIYLKVVNTKQEDIPLLFSINGRKIGSCSALTVTPPIDPKKNATDKLKWVNSLKYPNLIRAKPLAVEVKDPEVLVRLPSFSATVVTIQVE